MTQFIESAKDALFVIVAPIALGIICRELTYIRKALEKRNDQTFNK